MLCTHRLLKNTSLMRKVIQFSKSTSSKARGEKCVCGIDFLLNHHQTFACFPSLTCMPPSFPITHPLTLPYPHPGRLAATERRPSRRWGSQGNRRGKRVCLRSFSQAINQETQLRKRRRREPPSTRPRCFPS